jgi:hypothetical protein
MRTAALLLMACLAGCSLSSSGGECVSDSQCGDEICTRGGECTAKANVRSVLVKWTVEGVAASVTSCNTHPFLSLQFDGTDYGDTLRFEQVACSQGQFNVDKLPKRFARVELGFDGGSSSVLPIDAVTGQVQFDLFP